MGIAPHYQGVILAAGEGTRLGLLSEQLPKALVPVYNRPLLDYQLEHMRHLGIEDVIIVIGHLGDSIRSRFGDGASYGLRIRYVEQGERLGLAHAVGQLDEYIEDAFVLLLGDIYFDVHNLREIFHVFQSEDVAGVLAVKHEDDIDAIRRNFSVVADSQGRVSRVEEKPHHVVSSLKGCGLYVFDRSIFDAVAQTPCSSLRNEFELTDAIQQLIDMGKDVRTSGVVLKDINITYVSDIIDCNVYELNKRGLTSLQGKGNTVASGCVLNRSVLGDHVQIPNAITLDECVVMDGSVIQSSTNLQRAVVTPHAILT